MGEPELQPCRWCGSPAITNASLDLVQCRDIECPAGRSLYRRDKWNAVAPNPLAATLAARDERIRELEAEAEKIRDTAVSIELVKVASVDLVQDADGRDHAVLSTSWGIGLHRQHNCDEEGCGCWHVIARPPLSVESRVALLDLRSAKDDAKRERDEARARIATLERELAEARTDCHDRNHVGLREVLCGARLPDASLGQDAALAAHLLGAMEAELAEARQREEDATDLILRQGRELAALRPKAEAAERLAFRERQVRASEAVSWAIDWQDATAALLAACPAEEPREVVEPKSAVGLAVEELQRRQVVEPAPAPTRYRCEGCGWVGEAAATKLVEDPNTWDFERVHVVGTIQRWCGPVVPVTDAKPAGAADGEAG